MIRPQPTSTLFPYTTLFRSLEGHTESVTSVAFRPDGKMLASASADNSIRLWDPETGKQIGSPLKGHADAVTSVALDRKSTRLNSSHANISYAVFCLKKKTKK